MATRRRRRFTPDFKKRVALEALRGIGRCRDRRPARGPSPRCGVRTESHACWLQARGSWRRTSARPCSYPIPYAIGARIAPDYPGLPVRNRSVIPVSGVAAVGQAPSNSEPIRSGRPSWAGDIDRCRSSTTAASGWPAPTSIPGSPNAYLGRGSGNRSGEAGMDMRLAQPDGPSASGETPAD